ncbi:MAG: methionine--tRNA ligase subunit beta [Holophagaceae bacterium]
MSEVEDLSPKVPQIDALKAEITFDEFTKMDLRVGLVLEASRIPKSDKLIHLIVDLGMERRTIVAGIGKAYEPETLINKRIVVIANLAPRKLMGIESRGMVMAASGPDTLPFLIEIPVGAEPGHVVR